MENLFQNFETSMTGFSTLPERSKTQRRICAVPNKGNQSRWSPWLRKGGRPKSRGLARATSALRKNLQIATKIVFLQMPSSMSRISSRDELQKRNPGIETNFRRIDANHFTAVAYRHGKELRRCRIWLGKRREFVGGIAYSTDLSHGDNSYNESLSVEDDGYTLFLKPLGMA